MNIHEEVNVFDDLTICAYYAGHVLGAAMFLIKVGDESVLYTGVFIVLIVYFRMIFNSFQN